MKFCMFSYFYDILESLCSLVLFRTDAWIGNEVSRDAGMLEERRDTVVKVEFGPWLARGKRGLLLLGVNVVP